LPLLQAGRRLEPLKRFKFFRGNTTRRCAPSPRNNWRTNTLNARKISLLHFFGRGSARNTCAYLRVLVFGMRLPITRTFFQYTACWHSPVVRGASRLFRHLARSRKARFPSGCRPPAAAEQLKGRAGSRIPCMWTGCARSDHHANCVRIFVLLVF
jgi:hypothetical protein